MSEELLDNVDYRIAKPSTLSSGVQIDGFGHIVVNYLDENGQRAIIDLTATIQNIAKAAVDAHEKKYHSHQL